MQRLLQRVRGALGIGLTWGILWGFVGGFPRWVLGIRADAPFGIIFAVLGFMAGVIFSVVLMLAEGRRRFDQMSLKRFAAWGAAGGLLLASLFARLASLEWGDILAIAPAFALGCAACASGSLALARRAAMRELPERGEQIATSELTDRETQKLR